MDTLSVTVRYRPIRIGWCVRTGDFEAFRTALKLSFTMWGGRYNPIIPVDDFELASSLVRLFRVDVLWPGSNDEEIKDFITKFPYLPDSFFQQEVFVRRGNGQLEPQFVDICHPVRRLHKEHFKNNPSPDATVTILEWKAEDPLVDILLATFGSVPSVEITGTDYLGLLRRHLSAKTVVLSPEDPLPPSVRNDWIVSTFCRAFVLRHYSIQNWWGHPGVYIGSACDFDDLVTFWNLRATDTSLMFYDSSHAKRLDTSLADFLEVLRSRPKGRLESQNSIAIWFKESTPKPDVSLFGKGLRLCAARDGTWNGHNVKAPYMYFSEASALAAVGDDLTGPRVSFQLPPKPFSEEESRLHSQHLVVSVDPGIGLFGNERATLHTPYISELNEYYGRHCYFDWDKARVEAGGLGIVSDATIPDLSLRGLNIVDLLRQVFSLAGIDAKPSKAGLIASRLVQQMGGLQGCRVFKIAGVRSLIEKYGPDQSFTRGGAIQEIRAANAEGGNVSFPLYEDLYIESRPIGTKLKPDAVLANLLKKGVFRPGLRFDCPSCELEFWIVLDDVRTEVTCQYCGHRFNVAPYLKDRDWAFRRSGLFGRDDHQEGAIPVILLLQQFQTAWRSSEMLYTTAMSLRSTTRGIDCETDFVVLVERPIDEKVDIVIGECKTRKEITDDDVDNLRAVADAFPTERFNAYIVFAKLGPFSATELARLRRVNSPYRRRVILFTDRELEPYHMYERTVQEFKIDQNAVSCEDMANITAQVFLQPGCATHSTVDDEA